MSTDRASFQLSLPDFEGNIGELTRLAIEQRVAAEDVSVSVIIAQFTEYLAETDALDLELIGDFLADGARLLLLKSSRLLAQPAPVEEDSARPASTAWIERDVLRALSLELRVLEGQESIAPLRSPVNVERQIEPRPPEVLRQTWLQLHARGNRIQAAVHVPAFVRLEAAMSRLIRGLKASRHVSFRRVVRDAGRNDVVIHFLAVLELVRRHEAAAVQQTLFGDIVVEHGERAREADSRAG